MDEIANLLKATPNIFTNLIAFTNQDTSELCVRCQVDPGATEDDIDDLYQAVVDIAVRLVANDTHLTARIDLEMPDIEEFDPSFSVARKVELVKHVPNCVLFRKTYFDPDANKYRIINEEITF